MNKHKHGFVIAGMTAVSGMMLMGCVPTEEPQSEGAPAAPRIKSIEEAAYLDALADEKITLPDPVYVARKVCSVLDSEPAPDAGYLLGVALGVATEYSLTSRDGGYVVGAAVASFCPEYIELVGSW